MAPDNRDPEDRAFASPAPDPGEPNQQQPDLPPVLGEGTPANVDLAKLGEADNPEADWGEDLGGEAVFGANHGRRAVRTEAERGQGAKTRKATKDQISGRG